MRGVKRFADKEESRRVLKNDRDHGDAAIHFPASNHDSEIVARILVFLAHRGSFAARFPVLEAGTPLPCRSAAKRRPPRGTLAVFGPLRSAACGLRPP